MGDSEEHEDMEGMGIYAERDEDETIPDDAPSDSTSGFAAMSNKAAVFLE